MTVDSSNGVLVPDNIVPWRFSAGDEFELPGGRGRLERLAFDSGVVLYRSEIEIFDTCVIAVQNRLAGPWLGIHAHVAGESVMETPDGRTYEISPDRSLILRVDQDGTKFHFRGGQLLRHVGVATTMPLLGRRLGGALPDVLGPFAKEGDQAPIVREVATFSRMRALAASLFSPRADGPLRLLMLEGIATQILSETIDAMCFSKNEDARGIAKWERLALADVIQKVQSDSATPFSIPGLATDVGLSANRLERIFRYEFGRSPADFIRSERLREAHRLLKIGDLPIKDIAVQVGYAHVSNFSRAYRTHFGETPARTLRRSRNARLLN